MVVSIILLAVGIVGALICISAATRLRSVTDDYATAANLAQKRLASVATDLATQQSQFTASDQQGDFSDTNPGFSWQQQVETTELPDLDRVTITISWQAGSGQRQAQFVTYVRVPTTTASLGLQTTQ